MHLPLPHRPEQYPSRPWTGRPQPPQPRQNVWPLLAAVLVVGAMAVAMALYIQATAEDTEASLADSATVPVAATREQCLAVLHLYLRWDDTGPPVTLDETRGLNAKSAGAALAAGQAFASELDSQSGWLAPELVAAVREYDAAMMAMSAALAAGTASPEQITAVWSAGGKVHVMFQAFLDQSCV